MPNYITKYVIMKGRWLSHCQWHDTRAAADEDCARMEAIRLAENEKAKTWVYSGKGSAFMKPRHSDEVYTVAEKLVRSDE